MRRLCIWLPIALAGGALLAGCGGSSSSTSSNSKSSSGTGTTSSQSSNVAGGTTSTGAARETGPAATHPLTPNQQVEACKRTVQAPSALSASTKAKLLKSCNQLGGNESARRKLVHEVCEAIANSSLPAGAARERGLALCRRAP